ncbi:hypothetical protein Bca101_057307 [Brassica carinata]
MAPLLLFLILHKINRCNVYGNGWIVDITHRITPEMISWGTGGVGLGQFLWLKKSIKKGDNINSSFMNLSVYTGTHVDAPGHFIGSDFDAGFHVDNLDLDVFNGVDYLSVAAYDDLDSAHIELLMSKEIIPVEGLKLDEVDSGLYYVNCLPMRLIGAEGSPVRCVLLS